MKHCIKCHKTDFIDNIKFHVANKVTKFFMGDICNKCYLKCDEEYNKTLEFINSGKLKLTNKTSFGHTPLLNKNRSNYY